MATKHDTGVARTRAESKEVNQAREKAQSTGTHWGWTAMSVKANLTFHVEQIWEAEKTLTQSPSGSNTTRDIYPTLMSLCPPKPLT